MTSPENLNTIALLTFRVLKERAVNGQVDISVDELSKAVHAGSSSIGRALKQLREQGLIISEIRATQKGRTRSRHTIVGEATPQPSLELDTTQTIDEVSVYELLKPRKSDGYLNATLMCKAYGKLLADWTRLKSTHTLVDALSIDMGIPITGLIETIQGGTPTKQGTWIHPDLAVQLAQWLDPQFALFVSRLVRNFYAGHGLEPQPQLQAQRPELQVPTDFEGALELSLTLVRMNKNLHNHIATVRAQLEAMLDTLDDLEGN